MQGVCVSQSFEQCEYGLKDFGLLVVAGVATFGQKEMRSESLSGRATVVLLLVLNMCGFCLII